MASITCALRAVARPAAMRMAAPRAAFRLLSTSRPIFAKKYTKDHEWIDLSADRKSATVGISEYAAEQLGDVVYVELPETSGEFIEQGDAIGAVESVKSASDINAPIKCKVVQGNVLLEEKPSTINQVPEDDSNGGGWIVKVEVDEQGAKEYDELMDAEAYKSFTSE
ncbi:Glycine cleavage H-protein [Moelleriella libera RCEF 2490]|uniref:Glycine cleavage system H protein n=1 Tax=Moelleriella libera RCEF 2490 TaxID=1081109 RepID=A0A167ZML9_9HYPO|nr:Glycine cleavage H-protein [Moelleriella libera RCEF 2490]